MEKEPNICGFRLEPDIIEMVSSVQRFVLMIRRWYDQKKAPITITDRNAAMDVFTSAANRVFGVGLNNHKVVFDETVWPPIDKEIYGKRVRLFTKRDAAVEFHVFDIDLNRDIHDCVKFSTSNIYFDIFRVVFSDDIEPNFETTTIQGKVVELDPKNA